MKTPKSERISQAPLIKVYKEIAPMLAIMGLPQQLVPCKAADTMKNYLEGIKRVRVCVDAYRKVYELLKPEVWQYYDNVLGTDAKEFREVKLRKSAKSAVKRAIDDCVALKKAPKDGPASPKA